MISRNYQAAPFVTGSDQLKQDRGLGLILSHIAEGFEDEQVVFVELLDGTFQRQRLPSLLQTLHKIGGSGEQHPVAVLDERMTEGGAEVQPSRPAGAEQQDRAASVDPSVAGGERDSVRTTEHRHSGEIEAVERLAGQQAGLDQVALDASLIPFGEFQLGEGRQQSRCRPTFAVGALGRPSAWLRPRLSRSS